MKVEPGSLEAKRKTALARRVRVRSVLRGFLLKEVRGATVSTMKVTVSLIPTLPAEVFAPDGEAVDPVRERDRAA